jgi:general secretion pathway protein K
MSRERRRGGALLLVLWLSAALSAIAFSVALRVRAELERAGGDADGLRAYYLACGAVERAYNYMRYGPGPRDEAGRARYWDPLDPRLVLQFPEGVAVVEVIPESSRFNINTISREELGRLLFVLGVEPERARLIQAGVMHWRGSELSDLDTLYLSGTPSFRAPRASFEQIEELMSVAGVTPELFHGGYARTPGGAVGRRAGLRDCLSTYSKGTGFDINTAPPAVMMAVGVSAPAAEAIVAMRRQAPIRDLQAVAPLLGPAAARFRLSGDNIYTLRATARLRRPDGRWSDARRAVAMTVQMFSTVSPSGYRILAWQDSATADTGELAWPE